MAFIEADTGERLIFIDRRPPGNAASRGAALEQLDLREVGPAHFFSYQPASRLNLLTGDNSLGKTFIMEGIWWSLTDTWSTGDPLRPRRDVAPSVPRISAKLRASSNRTESFDAEYDWDSQAWRSRVKRNTLPGLVVYSRFDGSCAVFDPSRVHFDAAQSGPAALIFSASEVWNGLKAPGRFPEERYYSSGLIRDWVLWQVGGAKFQNRFDALKAALEMLAPSPQEPLSIGDPIDLPPFAFELPALRMPYGDVPIVHASAGVRRVAALAYVLVWAWHQHLINAAATRRPAQRQLVVIIDEVEAHLHPRWQRVIVPALMRTLEGLATNVAVQLHIATHSPLVMASIETVFDRTKDDLHHLRLSGNEVVLEELPFVKRGTVDAWLMSDVFGLEHARSVEAEAAIEAAKDIQLAKAPEEQAVREVNAKLVRSLAADDTFWPRWRFFARQHGITR